MRQQIPNANLPDRIKYAFDAYFTASGANEPHIQITDGQPSQQGNPSYLTNNSSWMQNELRESAHRLPSLPNALTTTYNYGSPYRHLLPSVQVGQGGQLFINNGTLPASGGTAATQTLPAAGQFEVFTSACGTVVQVQSGGQVTVGTSASYSGSLQMAANSLLILEAGSRLNVGPGSYLRLLAGATLVVRRGATLALAGGVRLEGGAYVCVEDQASLQPGSLPLDVDLRASYGANPALLNNPALSYLNLGTLACGQPAYEMNITEYSQTSQCTSPSGRDNYARWTATSRGGTPPYTYTWLLDPNPASSGGSNFQPLPFNASVSASGGRSTLGLCLNGYPYYVMVKVVGTDAAGQQASDTYYGLTQLRAYPNPASDYTDLASEMGTGASPALSLSQSAPSANVTSALSTASPTTNATAAAAAGNRSALKLVVYNGQGVPVFSREKLPATGLRLDTRAWPNGLYQVRLTGGKQTTTTQLSIQH